MEEILDKARVLAFQGMEQEEIEQRLTLHIEDSTKRKAINAGIQDLVFSYKAARAKKAQLKDRALMYLFFSLFGVSIIIYSYYIIQSHLIVFFGLILIGGYFAVTNYKALSKELPDIELDRKKRIKDRKERRF